MGVLFMKRSLCDTDEEECCVFVCYHPIYSGRQACGRTSRGHTGFLHLPSVVLALFFFAKMIQPFLPLVDREVEFYEFDVLHLLGFSFSFL